MAGATSREGEGRDRGEEGQSTVEYLLVAFAIIAMVVALGAFVRLGSQGTLGRLATGAASHAISDVSLGDALLDVLLF